LTAKANPEVVSIMTKSNSGPLKSYVFVKTEIGQSTRVAMQILALDICQCRVLNVDRVIGDFDVIAQLEAPDIDSLGSVLTDAILELPGVVSVAAAWCTETSIDQHLPEPRRPLLVSAA
jgi:DNA-binding Lrp family transcriptional regulator